MNSIELPELLEKSSLKEKKIYYKGDLSLLRRGRVSVVGSRRPNAYAKEMTTRLCGMLAKEGVCIVSGGAIGIDALAHKAAKPENTIMVAATGLEMRYPAINKKLIEAIEQEGLVLSQFPPQTPAYPYNFVLRNELTVALGEVLVVTYADENSGTMRSVEYALSMGKKVYVLPHRLGESKATTRLLVRNEATLIEDLSEFVSQMADTKVQSGHDPALEFFATAPTYDEALQKFGSLLFSYELEGKIVIREGRVYLS